MCGPNETEAPAEDMDAFDADVLIFAAAPGHPLGRRVLALFPMEPVAQPRPPAGIGSVLLLPEVLSKPIREGSGADRFLTNNRRDFPRTIAEIVTYPADLPDPEPLTPSLLALAESRRMRPWLSRSWPQGRGGGR